MSDLRTPLRCTTPQGTTTDPEVPPPLGRKRRYSSGKVPNGDAKPLEGAGGSDDSGLHDKRSTGSSLLFRDIPNGDVCSGEDTVDSDDDEPEHDRPPAKRQKR